MSDSDAQKAVVEAVEAVFRDTVGAHIQGALMDHTLKLWRDFAAEVDVSRTQKPETWAAALLYASVRLRLESISQGEAAGSFGVSSVTVSTKYRTIAETLDLVLLDSRYVPEAQRAVARRRYPSTPDDLPLVEAPTELWSFRFGPEDSMGMGFAAFEAAEEHIFSGWDALQQSNLEEAEAHFQSALNDDPWRIDAYNGRAAVAEYRGDLETAEAFYQEGYERGREMLASESPDAYWWWSELDTRPYMRARAGLASIYWTRKQYRDAIDEYEALLHLNPNDNQGVRYVIGPLYQLAGDLEGALKHYRMYEEEYPDDWGDPHHTFSWGLALQQSGRPRPALKKWYEGFYQNIYIAPLLLNAPLPPENILHFSNLEYPSYAGSYLDTFQPLWAEAADAKRLLKRLWTDPDVEDARTQWVDFGQQMQVLAEGTEHDKATQQRWERLVKKRRAIADRPPSKAVRKRVASHV